MFSFPATKADLKGNMAFTIVKPSQMSTDNSQTNICRIWVFQLRILYYLGISPYRPVYETGNEQWVLERSTHIGQILSIALFWIPNITHRVSNMIRKIELMNKGKKRTPHTYFSLLTAILYVIQNVFFFVILQKRKQSFETLLNRSNSTHLSSASSRPDTRTWSSRRLLMILLAFIFTFRAANEILKFVAQHRLGTPFESPSEIFFKLVQGGRRRFYLPAKENISGAEDYMLGTFEVLVRFARQLAFGISETLFTATLPATFWFATKHLHDLITDYDITFESSAGNQYLPDHIFKTYYELKKFCKSANDIWSGFYLLWLMQVSMNLAFLMDDVLGAGNAYTLVVFAVTIILRTVALILSGDVYEKIECFKGWLMERINWGHFKGSSEEKNELRLIALELDSRPIGIGSSGFYQQTYGFIAQLGLALITIFLIRFDK